MRSVLVTGAAGGIGSHTARLLHARGWLVGCYDRDAVGATELASSLGAGAIGGRLDVTADDERQAALAEVSTAAGGGLHALVNNAGILASGLLVEMPMLDHERQVAINLLGVIAGARAAHPLLAATPGSVLVNVASASAVHGQPGLATYAATKAAVRSLTEALSLEWQVRCGWSTCCRCGSGRRCSPVPAATRSCATSACGSRPRRWRRPSCAPSRPRIG